MQSFLLRRLQASLTRCLIAENHQSHSRCVPRLHVHLHCGVYHSCLSNHGKGSGQATPGYHVPHVSSDCDSGSRTPDLEADLASLWPAPCLLTLSHMRLVGKYWLREESRLQLHVRMQSHCSILHQSSSSYWQRRCHGDILQEGACSVHGYLDSTSHHRRPSLTVYLRFRGRACGLQMDLLGPRDCKCPFHIPTPLSNLLATDQRRPVHSVPLLRA